MKTRSIIGVLLALVIAASIFTSAYADGTINWGGHGATTCTNGAHWVLSPSQGITGAVLTVDGASYTMHQSGGGSWSADSAGTVTPSSSASVAYTGTFTGNGTMSLQLSHCLSGGSTATATNTATATATATATTVSTEPPGTEPPSTATPTATTNPCLENPEQCQPHASPTATSKPPDWSYCYNMLGGQGQQFKNNAAGTPVPYSVWDKKACADHLNKSGVNDWFANFWAWLTSLGH